VDQQIRQSNTGTWKHFRTFAKRALTHQKWICWASMKRTLTYFSQLQVTT